MAQITDLNPTSILGDADEVMLKKVGGEDFRLNGSDLVSSRQPTTLEIYDGVAEDKIITPKALNERILMGVGGENLLSNSHFYQPSPDAGVFPPPIGGMDYTAGQQPFLNWFVSAGGITGLSRDPATGLIDSTGGSLYSDVPKSGPLGEYTGALVASWGNNNGQPTEDGVVISIDGTNPDYYRVTLTPNGCFSAKMEQGVVASRHDVDGLNKSFVTSNTVLHDELEGAKSRTDVAEGSQVEISDRGDGKFEYVTGAIPDGFSIIQHDTLNLQIKLIPTSPVRGSFFGAKGIGASFDDGPSIQAAMDYQIKAPIREEYAGTVEVLLDPADVFYYITTDLIVRRMGTFGGSVPGSRGLGQCKIVCADTCDAGIWVQHPGGSSAPDPYKTELGPDAYGGMFAHINNLSLIPENEGMVDFGIIHNCPAMFSRVSCSEFKLANFFAHGQTSGGKAYGNPNGAPGVGTMYGNTDGSRYEYCHARLATNGHGFAAQGNDSQIMLYTDCQASGNKGSGFLDNSTIGNNYVGCDTAQNTVKVEHNGLFYMAVKKHTSDASNEPGVGVNWKNFWTVLVATTLDTTWALGVEFIACGGINIVDESGNFPYISGHYSEGGIEFGIVPRGGTTIVGGNVLGGRTYYPPDSSSSVQAFGGTQNTPSGWIANDDTYSWGSKLGSNRVNKDLYECGHTHDPDVATSGNNGITINYSTSRNSYEFLKGSSTRLMAFTTDNWVKNDHSGKSIYFEQGIIIGGPRANKIRSSFSSTTTGALTVEKGEWITYTNVVPGGIPGGQVTTAGILGSTAVLKDMAAIAV